MSSFDEAPPPVLDMTRVIAYAIVDESEEARAWIYENSDHITCHFCGRRPGEFQQIAAGKLSAICNVCLDSLYADMHEPSERSGTSLTE